MPLLHLGDDRQSARVSHAPGTGYLWLCQGPVEVGPLHQLTLPDPGAQCRFSNGHFYVVGTAHSHMFMAPTSGPSGQVHKTLVLPLLCICRGNNLSYHNHIIIAHYNANYDCGKCLKQAFMSFSALHNHKKVCLRFTKKPATGSDSKPSGGRGGDGSHSGSTRATPKKKDSKAPAANSQGSSTQTASQTMPCHSGQEKSHQHKSHKDSKKDSSGNKKKKKKKDVSPARKSSGNKVHKDGG